MSDQIQQVRDLLFDAVCAELEAQRAAAPQAVQPAIITEAERVTWCSASQEWQS